MPKKIATRVLFHSTGLACLALQGFRRGRCSLNVLFPSLCMRCQARALLDRMQESAVGPSERARIVHVSRALAISQCISDLATRSCPSSFLDSLFSFWPPSALSSSFRPPNPDGAGTQSTLLAYLQSASLRPCHVILDGGKRYWETHHGGTGTEYELILSHQVTRDES